jgi:oxazoline/thiazoline dehydrogenase
VNVLTGTAGVALLPGQADVELVGSDAELALQLRTGPRMLSDLAHDLDPVRSHVTLQRLWSLAALQLIDDVTEPRMACMPLIPGQHLSLATINSGTPYKLSRFALLRRAETAGVVIENPLSPTRIQLDLDTAVADILPFAEPTTLGELVGRNDSRPRERLCGEMLVLRTGGIIEPCDERGHIREDIDPFARQWEFHDLLFHVRSRQGMHRDPIGAQYRWRGEIEPPPAIRPNPWAAGAIPLPQFNLDAISRRDASFTAVLESRRSGRNHNVFAPIGLGQVAEFLYRTARVRDRFDTEAGQFTSRPYPSGGASYELELYLTVNQCLGLGRGTYYYDAEQHALCLVTRPTDDTEGLLDDAWQSSAFQCRPQILITIASRFQRVSWKYSGMAYATQLKNLGVLLQTMYLVATSMGLEGSALGLGNIARFARITGYDPLVEGSIGEFMIGRSG